MSNHLNVISAFLDDEPFDPQELTEALSDAEGRTFLIDAIALRAIVQPQDPVPVLNQAPLRARPKWILASAAAALVVGLLGGYFVAGRRAPAALAIEAPQPTRVVQAVPFIPTTQTGAIR